MPANQVREGPTHGKHGLPMVHKAFYTTSEKTHTEHYTQQFLKIDRFFIGFVCVKIDRMLFSVF